MPVFFLDWRVPERPWTLQAAYWCLDEGPSDGTIVRKGMDAGSAAPTVEHDDVDSRYQA